MSWAKKVKVALYGPEADLSETGKEEARTAGQVGRQAADVSHTSCCSGVSPVRRTDGWNEKCRR